MKGLKILILLLLPVLALGQSTPVDNPKLRGTGDFNGLTNKPIVRTQLQVRAQGDVVVTHSNGSTTPYVAAANTDVARGQALISAVTAQAASQQIHIGPGTFEIPSYIQISSLNLKIIGSGIGVTTIKLGDQGASPGASGPVIISTDAWSGAEISDLTVDCNLAGQSGASARVSAVGLYGSNCTIRRVHAKNWGTKGSIETFVLSVNAYPGAPHYNGMIDGCIVDTPAAVSHGSGGTIAITVSGAQNAANYETPGDEWMFGGTIKNCIVANVTAGTGSGQVRTFAAYSISGCQGGEIIDNYAINLLDSATRDTCTAIYNDSWSTYNLRIARNHLINVAYGINYSMGSSDYRLRDLIIENNRIQLIDTPASVFNPVGITVTGHTSGTNKALRTNIRNNTVTGPTATYGNGITLLNSTEGVIEGNIINAVNATISTDITSSDTRQYFNYSSAGAVVGVPTPVFGPGSSTAPTLTFVGDADTGFYQYDANQIGIALGGAHVGRFFGSGSLYITGGLSLGTPLDPTFGGSGAATLTGILLGNGASAFTGIASSTDGQVLRRAASAYSFGALDLADSDAITGTLPVANGGNRIRTAIKAADETRTSNTTITNDGALILSVLSGKTYKYSALIHITEESATPGVGLGVNGPTNSFFKGFAKLFTGSGILGFGAVAAYAADGGINYVEGNTTVFYELSGSFTTTAAGNFAVAWRQSTTSADDTTVKAGSWLTVEEQ